MNKVSTWMSSQSVNKDVHSNSEALNYGNAPAANHSNTAQDTLMIIHDSRLMAALTTPCHAGVLEREQVQGGHACSSRRRRHSTGICWLFHDYRGGSRYRQCAMGMCLQVSRQSSALTSSHLSHANLAWTSRHFLHDSFIAHEDDIITAEGCNRPWPIPVPSSEAQRCPPPFLSLNGRCLTGRWDL